MKRTKVYIAAPYRSDSRRDGGALNQAYGEFDAPGRVELLERIEDMFLEHGWNTCLPHRDEGNWGGTYYDPPAISALCLRHVDTSDLICAIPERSRGVHVELGRASCNGIPIITFQLHNEEPSTLQSGLGVPAKRKDQPPGRGELLELRVESYEDIPSVLGSILGGSRTAVTTAARNVAIVDIGSNSIKLSIFSVRPGRKSKLLKNPQRDSIGIADSVRSSGTVSMEKLEEVRTVLQRFASEIAGVQAEARVVGTEALRKASNSLEVDAVVKDTLGVNLAILSQADEAQSVVRAVRSTLTEWDSTAVLNLGASSVQIVGNAADPDGTVHLLGFGTKEISAVVPWTRPMSKSDWVAARQAAIERISSITNSADEPPTYIVHTGGELDFLLRCGVPMQTFRHSNSHVSAIGVADFEEFAIEFAGRDPQEVAARTGLQGGWLAGAVASNAIAVATAEVLGARILVPSNLNVVDGLL